jgi:hypothetical protein
LEDVAVLFPKCKERRDVSSFSLHVVVSTDDDEKTTSNVSPRTFVDLLANEDTENAFRWIEKERRRKTKTKNVLCGRKTAVLWEESRERKKGG